MENKTNIKIAMWSGPRNISTAMMRSFENREDTCVIDEPFYAYYLNKTGLNHPGRNLVLKSQSIDWDTIVNEITQQSIPNKMIFYQKHMVHHLRFAKSDDLNWLNIFNNCFLIRHPKEVIMSYSKKAEIKNVDDIGFANQLDLFKKIKDITGIIPTVVDSRDILGNPEKYLKKLCNIFNIDFSKKMLFWSKGIRDTDGVWAKYWYKNVIDSTGFKPYTASKDKFPSKYEYILNESLPYYNYLYSLKI